MNIDAKDIPAWWGAILSTILAFIGVIRYFLTRPKLDVELTLKKSDDIKFPNRVERLNLKIISSHTTTVLRCDIRAYETFNWKCKLFGMRVVSAAYLGDFPLPKRIEAADVIYGWLDAGILYDHFDSARGRFRIEVFDTLHKRPAKLRLNLPPDFKKTQEPRSGIVHTVLVDGLTEPGLKQLSKAFSKEFGLKELRSSRSSGTPLVQFEFILPEHAIFKRISDVVTLQGGSVQKFHVR